VVVELYDLLNLTVTIQWLHVACHLA